MELFSGLGFAQAIKSLQGLALAAMLGVTFYQTVISHWEEKKMGPVLQRLVLGTIIIVGGPSIMNFISKLTNSTLSSL